MSKYDAIVIGAGHNGLTNAAYLAKSLQLLTLVLKLLAQLIKMHPNMLVSMLDPIEINLYVQYPRVEQSE